MTAPGYTSRAEYDVAIAGGGPAGAVCATLCAVAGLRTLVLEKSRFPRDKVCGDCVNPGCWSVLQELGVVDAILAAPHLRIPSVTFSTPGGRAVTFPLPASEPGEIAITRRLFDDILLHRAIDAGADVREECPIHSLQRDPSGHWRIRTPNDSFTARHLVAADGRNSTVARLLRTAPAARRDRIGLQAHLPIPSGMAAGIQLHLLPHGYCGIAPVGGGMANFCLVATAREIDALKAAVSNRFGISREQQWRSIAPLARAPIGPLRDGVLYIGDAARVVEPFTGEGIYYTLQSARLAARSLAAGSVGQYPASHAALYRRRLWINRLARSAVTHPRAGALLLRALSAHPAPLQYLVHRVNAASREAATPH
jgi:geranylgeranyl reductase family protein